MNTFGDADCTQLAVILRGMKFRTTERRVVRLTRDHANAIRKKAHELRRHGIALAQAFQTDCMLSQIDVIGTWVPVSEKGVDSDVIRNEQKWVQGLRWNEIDDELVLRHPPSRGGATIEVRLSECPMVMEELQRLDARPRTGAVIINERTRYPYVQDAFRDDWRKVANAAGVPRSVRNSDSRPRHSKNKPVTVWERLRES